MQLPSASWGGAAVALAVFFAAAAVVPASAAKATHLRSSTASDSIAFGSSSNIDYKLRMENFHNVQYSAPFRVGSQTLPVIYDTGSFEILVVSTLCHSCSSRHVKYDSTQSSSFVYGKGVTAEHLFGSGSVYSRKDFETVRLGDEYSPYVASHFPIWQVTDHTIQAWDQQAHFSGIVGLCQSDRIPDGFAVDGDRGETMVAKLGISSFSVCLQRGPLSPPGWISVGPTVSAFTIARGDFQTVDVHGAVHWEAKMTGLDIYGVDTSGICDWGCGAIFDSGTSLIVVPTSALSITNKLKAMVYKDCSNIHSLPTLKFNLGTATVELPPHAYVVKGFKQANECHAAFMSMDMTSDLGKVWILGMPFLRYYYTVFDRPNKKVHFTPSTPSCTMPPTTYLASVFGGFVNQTNLASTRTGDAAFSAADWQPMEADLLQARFPSFAGKNGTGNATLDL